MIPPEFVCDRGLKLRVCSYAGKHNPKESGCQYLETVFKKLTDRGV